MSGRTGRIAAAARRLRLASLALLASAALGGTAAAQPGSSDSYVLVAGFADRGEACGLIEDWEAAVMRAEARRLLARLPAEEQPALLDRAAERAAMLTCADAGMVEWLAAGRAGIAREWLPPNLAAWRALALMDPPPQLFLATALPVELSSAVAAIEARFAAWEAAGVAPEGGGSWVTYLEFVGEAATAMALGLAGRDDDGSDADAVAAMIAEIGLIGRLWLIAQGDEP